jgi:hypothetical protein
MGFNLADELSSDGDGLNFGVASEDSEDDDLDDSDEQDEDDDDSDDSDSDSK